MQFSWDSRHNKAQSGREWEGMLVKVSGIPGTSLLETTEAIFYGAVLWGCPQMIGANLPLFTRRPKPKLEASSFLVISS